MSTTTAAARGRKHIQTQNALGDLRFVGMIELIELFGIKEQTAYTWRYRGVLPEPDLVISSTPIWQLARIIAWAAETNRDIDRKVLRRLSK